MSAKRKLKRRAINTYLKTPQETIMAFNKGMITEKECDTRLKNKFNVKKLTAQEVKDKEILEGLKKVKEALL